MIYLILSILCSAMLSVVMRLSEGRIRNRTSMIAMNYLTCVVLGGGMIGFDKLFPAHAGMPLTVGISSVAGLLYMVSLLLMQYNIHCNGIVLPSVVSRVGGLLGPLILSILFFSEVPTALQIGGSILAIAAILLLTYRKHESAMEAKGALLMLLFVDGIGCSMAKIYNELGSGDLSDHFVAFAFGFALIFTLLLLLYKKERPGLAEIGFGVLVGIPNFIGSRFTLVALKSLPAVIVYPSRSVGSLVLVTLIGVFCFRERLTKKQLAAIAVILVSLLLLNI